MLFWSEPCLMSGEKLAKSLHSQMKAKMHKPCVIIPFYDFPTFLHSYLGRVLCWHLCGPGFLHDVFCTCLQSDECIHHQCIRILHPSPCPILTTPVCLCADCARSCCHHAVCAVRVGCASWPVPAGGSPLMPGAAASLSCSLCPFLLPPCCSHHAG